MRERLDAAVVDPAVTAIARGATTSYALRGSTWAAGIVVADGVVRIDDACEPAFTLSASDETWSALTSPRPPAGRHSVVHLERVGEITVAGDRLAYDRAVQIVRAVLDAVRGSRTAMDVGRSLEARGEYRRVTTSLGTSDLHVERAGAGTPLLALATAGSDTTQWHGVMTHTDLTERFELITVDLPWHGRSSPAWGEPVGSHRLTPETYTELIVAAADALGLERPVLVGVSMGGAAVVHAIATHPARFAGAVSCQAGPSVQARAHEHLRGTTVNASLFIPEWTYGLMNPASPEAFKQRVWWGYASGGFGLYAADIDSYLSWDLTAVEHLLKPASPHIAVLSGAFDTSVPSEASRALAARIPNASFEVMPELGHFPHAEHPQAFVAHLEPAIARVLAHDASER